MANHSRSKSRGSFSVFSIDTLRSFGRAGSRQVVRIHDDGNHHSRSESRLSNFCNPNEQPPASPEPPRVLSPFSPVSSAVDTPLMGTHAVQDQTEQIEKIGRKHGRRRPLSWIAFPRTPASSQYPRSMSAQLPKDTSFSTMSRSIISAPVLTSTTNVDVARVEGVHCGEMSGAAFSKSNWDSQLGWVSKEGPDVANITTSEGARSLADKIGAVSMDAEENASRNIPPKSRFSRFGHALRHRIGRTSSLWPGSLGHREQFFKIEEERRPSPTLEQGIARRRMETLNLCKDKIKELTGHGHIRRKSMSDSKIQGLAAAIADDTEHPPLLPSRMDAVDFTSTSGDHKEAQVDSLSRSFNSALEKLDFQTSLPCNMTFLKSKSSLFNLKKPVNNGTLENQELGKSVIPNTSKAQNPVPTSFPSTPSSNQLPPKPKWASTLEAQTYPEPSKYSAEQGGYVSATPCPGYPRGVNPLRMHTDVTNVQSSRIDRGGLGPLSQVPKPSSQVTDEDDSVSDLEDAPIYSPSLGDLTQYARTPPSSSKLNADVPRMPLPHETPTRAPMAGVGTQHTGRRGIKKSRSGLGLFHRSGNDKNHAKEGREHRRSCTVGPGAGADTPLRPKDSNRLLGSVDRQLKKSRSIVFGGIFSKDDTPPQATTDMFSDRTTSFAPTTPSPLRHETRIRHEDFSGLRDQAQTMSTLTPTWTVDNGAASSRRRADIMNATEPENVSHIREWA